MKFNRNADCVLLQSKGATNVFSVELNRKYFIRSYHAAVLSWTYIVCEVTEPLLLKSGMYCTYSNINLFCNKRNLSFFCAPNSVNKII